MNGKVWDVAERRGAAPSGVACVVHCAATLLGHRDWVVALAAPGDGDGAMLASGSELRFKKLKLVYMLCEVAKLP